MSGAGMDGAWRELRAAATRRAGGGAPAGCPRGRTPRRRLAPGDSLRSTSAALLLLALAAAGSGCGYRFAVGGTGLAEGVHSVYVPVFANRSSEPEAGAIFSQALAEGLAREGRAAGPLAPARIEGEVLSLIASPAATTKTGRGVGIYQLSGVVRLRVVREGSEICRREVSGTEDFLPAQNLLELDASRRRAVRRLAERMMVSAQRELCPPL